MSEIDYTRLREEIEWWLDGRGEGAQLELATAAGTTERTIRRIRTGDTCSLDLADRLLQAIGYNYGPKRHPTRGHFIGPAIRWDSPNRKVRGDQKGRLKKDDFANAKLTYAQLHAIHRIHLEHGLSLREIARQGWQRWGYANEHSALNSLSERMISFGMKVRSPGEATALANGKRRIRGEHESKEEYKARKRREAREADPALAEAQRLRLEWLRLTHDPRPIYHPD